MADGYTLYSKLIGREDILILLHVHDNGMP